MTDQKTTTKVTNRVKRAIGKIVNDTNTAVDKLEEKGLAPEVARLIRPVATQRIKESADKAQKRREKIDKAKAMYSISHSFKEIGEALGVAESTARKLVASDDEEITLHSLSSLTLRIREYKREGLSNVAIGQRVGVSESTVRRRLKMPLTEEETFLEAMMDALRDARAGIIASLSEEPLFKTLFNEEDGHWILQINTTKRRAGFTRRDGVGQRMTFSLEFAAYRRPLPKNVAGE